MSPDDPRHGTYAGHAAHRKEGTPDCAACKIAAHRYRKVCRLEAHRGIRRQVSLGSEAHRITTIIPAAQLAKRAGIGENTVHRLRKGGPEHVVSRRVRDAVLSAALPTPIGIQRRLRALSALGYSMRQVGFHMGSDHADNLRSLVKKRDLKYVQEGFAARIVEVYESLSMRPAPQGRAETRARNRARVNGWAPPLAFDNIDDPDERPHGIVDLGIENLARGRFDEVVVDRLLSGVRLPSSPEEKAEALRRWVARGGSESALCQIHGWRVGRYEWEEAS